MRVSVNVPNFGHLPERIGLAAMAQAAEAAGADGIWLADHLLFVDETTTGYPYDPEGLYRQPATFPFYDSLTACAFLAAVTTRCRIGIGVLVLPQRNVLEVAKVAATIDRLSHGRFALGVGSGWNRLEMEALGCSFADRGERTNEMLQVLRDCWDGSPQPFKGRQVQIRERIKLFPTPAQQHGIPLLIGGMGRISMRRAAQHGDGWVAIAAVEDLDIDALAAAVSEVRSLRGERGGEFELVLKLHAEPEAAESVPAAVALVSELGFDEVVVDVPWTYGIDAACDILASCTAAAALIS
jgi:probable F420-dependent oxidoreductase